MSRESKSVTTQTNYIAGPYSTNRAERRLASKHYRKLKAQLERDYGTVWDAPESDWKILVDLQAARYADTKPPYRNTKVATAQRTLMGLGYSRRQARRLTAHRLSNPFAATNH